MGRVVVLAVAVAAAILGSPASVAAQVFGTFVWQTQPFCNRLALTLTTTPGGFTVAGTDDGCGAPHKASVTGALVLNPDGTAGLRVTVAPTDGARAVELWATVSTAHGGGSWSDSAGHHGTLVLGGAMPGLPARPATPTPVDVANHPATDVNPCFDGAAPATPVTPAFCGYSSGYWRHGGLGLPGVQLWKDGEGRVHLRGSAQKSSTQAGPFVLALPAGMRPKRTVTLSAQMSRASQNLGGTALIVIFGDDVATYRGLVAVQFQTDAADMSVHFGEVVFSVDR
jgi:hypothetical protein